MFSQTVFYPGFWNRNGIICLLDVLFGDAFAMECIPLVWYVWYLSCRLWFVLCVDIALWPGVHRLLNTSVILFIFCHICATMRYFTFFSLTDLSWLPEILSISEFRHCVSLWSYYWPTKPKLGSLGPPGLGFESHLPELSNWRSLCCYHLACAGSVPESTNYPQVDEEPLVRDYSLFNVKLK